MSTTGKKKTKPKTQRKSTSKPRAARKAPTPSKKQEPIPPSPTAPTPKKTEVPVEKSYLLAIRLRGGFGTPWLLQKALDTLRLKRKFNAVLLENTPSTIGMLRTVKDYVTWGEAHAAEIALVLTERGELSSGGAMTDETIRDKFGEPSIQDLASALTQGRITLQDLWRKGVSPIFRLRPPSGGFERSGKRAYGSGGELGRRPDSLATLLTRMT